MPDQPVSTDPVAAMQDILDDIVRTSLDPADHGAGDRAALLARAQREGFGASFVVCEKHATRAMPLPTFIFGHFTGSERENRRHNGDTAAPLHAPGDVRLAYDGESYPALIADRNSRRRAVKS